MRFLMVAAVFLVVVPSAFADGWDSYTEDENVVESTGAPAGSRFVEPRSLAVLVGGLDEPVAGVPGPQGPQGPRGEKGDKGDKGDSADLCQNVAGVQVVPGFKYNAQRYWGFLPKWEKRYLVINRKHQIVCVTLRWIRNHVRGR